MPPPPAMSTAVGRTDGMAIASFVLGILSVPGGVFYGVFGIVLGPIAIVLGLLARRRIKASGGVLSGGGLATAGWILGVCGVVIAVVEIVALVVLLVVWSTTTTTH